jgi:hypothetical protein
MEAIATGISLKPAYRDEAGIAEANDDRQSSFNPSVA